MYVCVHVCMLGCMVVRMYVRMQRIVLARVGCSSSPGPLQHYLSDMCANLPVDSESLPSHIRNSLDELRALADAGIPGNARGSRRCQLSVAVFKTNRLWLPDGSEHYAYHGLVGFIFSEL